jgi:hypothetical protein
VVGSVGLVVGTVDDPGETVTVRGFEGPELAVSERGERNDPPARGPTPPPRLSLSGAILSLSLGSLGFSGKARVHRQRGCTPNGHPELYAPDSSLVGSRSSSGTVRPRSDELLWSECLSAYGENGEGKGGRS